MLDCLELFAPKNKTRNDHKAHSKVKAIDSTGKLAPSQ